MSQSTPLRRTIAAIALLACISAASVFQDMFPQPFGRLLLVDLAAAVLGIGMALMIDSGGRAIGGSPEWPREWGIAVIIVGAAHAMVEWLFLRQSQAAVAAVIVSGACAAVLFVISHQRRARGRLAR